MKIGENVVQILEGQFEIEFPNFLVIVDVFVECRRRGCIDERRVGPEEIALT